MIRLFAASLALLLGLSLSAEAQLELRLLSDGTAELRNVSASPVSFSGYDIRCDVNNCINLGPLVSDPSDPTNQIPDYSAGNDRFFGIEALGIDNDAALVELLGRGARGFRTANPSARGVAEIGLSNAILAPNTAVRLGKMFNFTPPQLADLAVGNVLRGEALIDGNTAPIVINIPEPGSMALAGLAVMGLACATRRRLK